MLDAHAMLTTPGAILVLGNPGAVAVNDGAQVAGVPLEPSAILRMWGFHSPTADSIANIRLQSQDQIDPINGVTATPGAASLLLQWYDYTTLKYKTGARNIQVGTNVGVVAGNAFTIDEYRDRGKTVMARYADGNEVMFGAITFGGATTATQWLAAALTPVTAIPNGTYCILGVYVTALANVGLIRFTHADFQGLKPGFPVMDAELALAATAQVAMRDELVTVRVGEQFIALGEILGTPQCPVFRVSNAGTGLSCEVITAQAATPVINVVLMRLGD
jgi:hypothetical protein